MYHVDPETDDARIVGFEVIPSRFLTLYAFFYSIAVVLGFATVWAVMLLCLMLVLLLLCNSNIRKLEVYLNGCTVGCSVYITE